MQAIEGVIAKGKDCACGEVRAGINADGTHASCIALNSRAEHCAGAGSGGSDIPVFMAIICVMVVIMAIATLATRKLIPKKET